MREKDTLKKFQRDYKLREDRDFLRFVHNQLKRDKDKQ